MLEEPQHACKKVRWKNNGDKTKVIPSTMALNAPTKISVLEVKEEHGGAVQ